MGETERNLRFWKEPVDTKYFELHMCAKHTWNEANLDKWLTDTESVVPDNDMSFRVPNQEERAAIISYLKSLSIP